MKKAILNGLFAGAAMAAIGLVAPQASAADFDPVTGLPIYVSVFGGGSSLKEAGMWWYNPTLPYDYFYSVGTKTGYLLGGAIGAQVHDYIRLEAELSHSRWKANSAYSAYYQYASSNGDADASGSLKATYLLANVWFDFKNKSPITPYVGGGVGYGWASADVDMSNGFLGVGGSDSGFAYQLGGGVKFDVNEHFVIDAGYRYKVLDGLSFKETTAPGTSHFYDADLKSHNIQIGLTYRF